MNNRGIAGLAVVGIIAIVGAGVYAVSHGAIQGVQNFLIGR